MLKLGGLRMDNEWSPANTPLPQNLIRPLPMGGNLPPVQSPMNFYGATEFADFPEHKFIISICKNKSGHPLGSGLLFVLSWYWAAMNFSQEWFLNFAQIFGQPFRWANYSPEMDEGDQTKLINILAGMGSNAYAAFPEGTDMQFLESKIGAADNPQKAIIDMADHAARIIILRQTLTSDVGNSGSRALGDTHQGVLDAVKIGCGRFVCKSLNQMIRSIVILNCGDDSEMPAADVIVPDEDESEAASTAASNLSNAGYEADDEGLKILSQKIGYGLRRRPQAAPASGKTPIGESTEEVNAVSSLTNRNAHPSPNEEASAVPQETNLEGA